MHPQAAGQIVNTEGGRYAHPFDTCTTSNVRVSPSCEDKGRKLIALLNQPWRSIPMMLGGS